MKISWLRIHFFERVVQRRCLAAAFCYFISSFLFNFFVIGLVLIFRFYFSLSSLSLLSSSFFGANGRRWEYPQRFVFVVDAVIFRVSFFSVTSWCQEVMQVKKVHLLHLLLVLGLPVVLVLVDGLAGGNAYACGYRGRTSKPKKKIEKKASQRTMSGCRGREWGRESGAQRRP